MPRDLLDKRGRLCAPDQMGSYHPDDVIFVLKNLSNLIREQHNEDRESAIQQGIHYSEMLPVEYQPSLEYLALFYEVLQATKDRVAYAVALVAEQILKNRGTGVVLVSLARAGTPIGILIKRYLKGKYQLNPCHYSISIIRDKGIDENALIWILSQHPGAEVQFIDGWTGKGTIRNVLVASCTAFQDKYGVRLNPELAVLADPGHCATIYGTREDFLIPSACLNATVSGLVSRTFQRDDLIGEGDFHGAKYYAEWKDKDLSDFFLKAITECFPSNLVTVMSEKRLSLAVDTAKEIAAIQQEYGMVDVNKIKPGVGEATRVLLRRVPWRILVDHRDNPNLKHIILLSKDRGVPVDVYSKMSYAACGLIEPHLKDGLGAT